MPRVFADGGAQSLAAASSKIMSPKDWAVAFWLFRTGTPAAARALMGGLEGTGASGWFVTLTTGNLIQAASSFITTDKARASSTIPALNTWVHVAIVHKDTGTANTDFTFYFNGIAEAGTAVTTGAGTRTDNLAIPFTVGNGLAGLLAPPAHIGPIAFWERAISPAEALGLATGMHPLRFKEGLVELFDLDGSTIEDGYLFKLSLIQGATNPVNTGTVKPPMEVAIPALYHTRQNTRPRSNWRSRYIANAAAGGAVINDHNFRRVGRGVGIGVMRGAA